MTLPKPTTFETEARELCDDEHHGLAHELEVMRMERRPSREIAAWMEDYDWSDDPAEYFQTHRKHFLERAREEFAEEVV